MEDLDETQYGPTIMHDDNSACIALSKGEGRYLSSNHIGLRFHYLRERVESNELKLNYIMTEDQLEDLMTKTLAPKRYEVLMRKKVFSRFS